jgi:hypothetical protein
MGDWTKIQRVVSITVGLGQSIWEYWLRLNNTTTGRYMLLRLRMERSISLQCLWLSILR